MTGVMADRIDGVARTLGPPADLPSAPTGVGFCMALSRRWLNRVPRLDPAFGRGYGEEVDWCQKVRAMGGRHVGVPGLFVLHAGGASFGPERPACAPPPPRCCRAVIRAMTRRCRIFF
jgi:GT2 family glycosyltransferase